MATEEFSEAFVEALVSASAERDLVPGLMGTVGFGVGKKVQAVIAIVDGRAIGAVEEDPGATVPFTAAQFEAWLGGDLNLSQAYTKGDLKATGKTGDLLAALELLDDRAVVCSLRPPD